MQAFGTDEYGDKNSFEIKCKKCGRNNARIIPITTTEEGKIKKLVLEIHCSCGNNCGATIYG